MSATLRLPRDRVALLQVRLRCDEGDRGSLEIKSTFDKSERMEHRTDEAISFTHDDLVIIRNRRESPCRIALESIALGSGESLYCRPSRQGAFRLLARECSSVHSTRSIRLGGGESLVIQSSRWRPNLSRGSYSGPV